MCCDLVCIMAGWLQHLNASTFFRNVYDRLAKQRSKLIRMTVFSWESAVLTNPKPNIVSQ